VATHFIRVALLSVLGLAEGATLTEAGAWGVLAAVFLIVLLAVRQIVGIVLGVKAAGWVRGDWEGRESS
jgi:hypothetical protein